MFFYLCSLVYIYSTAIKVRQKYKIFARENEKGIKFTISFFTFVLLIN